MALNAKPHARLEPMQILPGFATTATTRVRHAGAEELTSALFALMVITGEATFA